MRSASLVAGALALLPAEVSATEVKGEGFLKMPVGTVQRPAGVKRAAKAFEDVLYNMDFFYATNVSIGNPPQQVTVLVDTGSSELWVNPDCRTTKTNLQASLCVKFGKYDPGKSRDAYGPFGKEELKYGDRSDPTTQTSATIYYYADTVALGEAKVSNQTFGVVAQSNGQSQGILGLAPDMKGGYDSNEPYSLVLNSMATQGVIANRVFSLDLRHTEDESGAVIYGGIDKSKFIGALEERPMVNGIRGEYRFAVELTTIGLTLSSSSTAKVSEDDANVMLDSGTTVSRMHPTIAMPILQALGAEDDGEGYYQVSCSMQESSGSVDFGFGSKTVRVPLKDFILSLGGSSDVCYVGMVLTKDQQILGESFLRAGYFVFDWDNRAVHIAQAADCGDGNIVAVASGKDGISSVTGDCKDNDAKFTGGTQPTHTLDNIPTHPYTTVYTITSCPQFDPGCQTGVVTTQRVQPAATGTGGGGDDNAGARANVKSCFVVVLGVLAMGFNVL